MTMVIITTITRIGDGQVHHHLLQEDTILVVDITQAAVITRVVIKSGVAQDTFLRHSVLSLSYV